MGPAQGLVLTRLATPGVEELPGVAHALREWQADDVPFPLHPGDLGWYQRSGPEATAAAVRSGTRDGRLLAVGLAMAAAAALRELGSSSAVVCTPAADVAAVATYRAAGFRPVPDVPDRRRAEPPVRRPAAPAARR